MLMRRKSENRPGNARQYIWISGWISSDCERFPFQHRPKNLFQQPARGRCIGEPCQAPGAVAKPGSCDPAIPVVTNRHFPLCVKMLIFRWCQVGLAETRGVAPYLRSCGSQGRRGTSVGRRATDLFGGRPCGAFGRGWGE